MKLEVDISARILIHTCCAPCSSAILECMLQNNIRPTIFYSNPNIYPFEEYQIRKLECERYARELQVEMVEDEYNHLDWLEHTKEWATEHERGHRCLICFKYRLLRSARYAAEHGYTLLTTTLASSRWKSLEQIDEAGLWAVNKINEETGSSLVWWRQNWRKNGLQERRNQLIKELRFYNQQYCGCEFSQK